MIEKEIQTEKLVLTDKLGNPRAVLEVEDSGVFLTIASHLDRRAIVICVDATGNPMIMLLDRDGKTRLSLSLTGDDDHSDIMLNDTGLQNTAFITIDAESGPSISLRHQSGHGIFLSNPDVGPIVAVSDCYGKARVQLDVDNHVATLDLFDANGNRLKRIP